MQIHEKGKAESADVKSLDVLEKSIQQAILYHTVLGVVMLI